MTFTTSIYDHIVHASQIARKQLAVLVDPEKFEAAEAAGFMRRLPADLDYIFVGGSTGEAYKTALTVKSLKAVTKVPLILFPGAYTQITEEADALLFLSLISGRNPEYLIGQQVKSVPKLIGSALQVIPTGYILIDGGKESAIQHVSQTSPIPQSEVETVVHTALAGQFSGKHLIYLEAGSGAKTPVSAEIISAVKSAVRIPVIVGGGIRSFKQLEMAYKSGADMVVVGTAFENTNTLYGRPKK